MTACNQVSVLASWMASGSVEEIEEMSDYPARECTEHALFAGGMTPDKITKELSDWRE